MTTGGSELRIEREYYLTDIVIALNNSETGVEIKNRKYHFRTYKNCFIGKDATTWLQAHLKCDKETAIRCGQTLIDEGFISHVVDENKPFLDEFLFYSVNVSSISYVISSIITQYIYSTIINLLFSYNYNFL